VPLGGGGRVWRGATVDQTERVGEKSEKLVFKITNMFMMEKIYPFNAHSDGRPTLIFGYCYRKYMPVYVDLEENIFS
jgi:hypothetical protein